MLLNIYFEKVEYRNLGGNIWIKLPKGYLVLIIENDSIVSILLAENLVRQRPVMLEEHSKELILEQWPHLEFI